LNVYLEDRLVDALANRGAAHLTGVGPNFPASNIEGDYLLQVAALLVV
jgi:hypothetical protein